MNATITNIADGVALRHKRHLQRQIDTDAVLGIAFALVISGIAWGLILAAVIWLRRAL